MTTLALATLQSRYAVITAVGIQFHPGISYREWAEIFATIRAIDHWVQFALGDCINYGKDHFGEDYVQELPLGYEATTLDNFASVARKIPLPRRRGGVSFSHHVEVANLCPEDQIAALSLARSDTNPYGMSVRQLRQFITNNGDPQPDAPPRCPTCGQIWWHAENT